MESVNRALAADRLILLVLQDDDADEPTAENLKRIGTVGVIRQMANGKSAGSRRTRCVLPCQANRVPRMRSSTSTDPLSGSFHSHKGTSNEASWAP